MISSRASRVFRLSEMKRASCNGNAQHWDTQTAKSFFNTAALDEWLGTAPLPGSNTGQVHGKEKSRSFVAFEHKNKAALLLKHSVSPLWSPLTSSLTQGKNLWSKMNFCFALLMLFFLAELHSPYSKHQRDAFSLQCHRKLQIHGNWWEISNWLLIT